MSAARARVVGLGSRLGGDDAVGLEVAREIRRDFPTIEAFDVADAATLVELVRGEGTLVVVDAAVGLDAPGVVREIDEDELERSTAVSSHALGARDAVRLARALHGEAACRRVRFVAVAIERPRALAERLTPEVLAAVPRAAKLAVELASDLGDRPNQPEGSSTGAR